MFCGALTVIPVGAIPAIFAGADTNPETGTIDYATSIEEYLKLDAEEAPIPSAKGKLDTMKLMVESSGYKIYADNITGEVAIVKSSTGEILFTNPWDITTSNTNSMDEKKKLLSQIIINYTDNGTAKTMNSTVDAAMRGQIKIKHIKNGIRVEYAIGRQNARYLVPRVITQASFGANVLAPAREAINNEVQITIIDKTYAANANERNGAKYYPNALKNGLIEVGKSYNYYDLLKMEYPDFDMAGPIDHEKDYRPLSQAMASYQQYGPNTTNKTHKDYEDLTKKVDIYVFDNKTTTELVKMERFIKTWATGYTYEQLDADHLEVGYEGTTKAPALFKLALEYTVDAQGLTVRLPANGIRFDESLYQLDSITVLPYMGAGKSANGGYNFFPDGSGALFDYKELNNGSNTTLAAQVYGTDFAYHKLTGKHQETVRYPVFGSVENWKGGKTVTDYDNLISAAQKDEDGNIIKPAVYGTKVIQTEEDRGFLAIIEEGDSMAQIATAHLNASSEYSAMQMTFFPRPSDTYNMSDAISVGQNTDIKVVSSRKYVGNYKIRYIMLTDDEIAAENRVSNYYECSWVGMAEAYRDYLEYAGVIERMTEETADANIPLYIETFGTVETVEKILSMPVNVMTPLTTFEDIKTMYNELSEAVNKEMGVDKEDEKAFTNINFKLTGYANGGMYSTVPYHLNWEESVGGAAGFEELVEYAREEGFGIFPDFDFAYINQTELFDGVTLLDHAVKTIDNRYTSRRAYDATYQTYVGYYELAISPAFFARFVTKFSINYMKYNPMGISVSTLGTDLNSDFDEEDPYNREDAMQFTISALRQLSLLKNEYDESMQVMVNGGNSYTLKYVDHIVNAPLNSSNYNAAGNTVPFIGMVLHGYKNYAGTPINEEGNLNAALLRAIENGSGLYFMLSYQNTDVLKEFDRLSENYSIRYDIWKDDVVAMYSELNKLMSDLQTKLIIDHDFLVADRIPDASEAEADKLAKEEAEALKEAEKLAAEAKEALKAALELRKTPGAKSDEIAKALKNASDQAIKATKAAAKIDAKYVDDAYAALKAANAAGEAADAAYLAIYNTAAYDAGEAAAKRNIPALFADSTVVATLKNQLGTAYDALVDEIYGKIVDKAAAAGAAEAIKVATKEPVKYLTSAAKAEADSKDQIAVIAVIKSAVETEIEAILSAADPAKLEAVKKITDTVYAELVTLVTKGAAGVITAATTGYETGKTAALKAANAVVEATEAKNAAIAAALEAGITLEDIQNSNTEPYDKALTEAKNAFNAAVLAAGEGEDNVISTYKSKLAIEEAQAKYDAVLAEYNAIAAEVNSGNTTAEERALLKEKTTALAKAKDALDKAQASYDELGVTGNYAAAVTAYEKVSIAEEKSALLTAAIDAVKAEKMAISLATDADNTAAALKLTANEKLAAFEALAPELRTQLVDLETAYVAAKAQKTAAEEALKLAKEATEKLLEKLNATKNDPEATAQEKERAQQFYDDATKSVATAEANLKAINDKLDAIKTIVDSEVVLRTKVLVFGDADIKTDYNDAATNNAGVVDGINGVIGNVQQVVDLKAKYEAAKADYEAAEKIYNELLLINVEKLDEAEATKVIADRIAATVVMAHAKDAMKTSKDSIETYTVVFRNRYETILNAYSVLEAAKADIDALVTESAALRDTNADANAIYLEAVQNKAYITSLYNDAKAQFDAFADLALLAGLIDEDGKTTSSVIKEDEKAEEEKTEETVSKYTYDDGSVVSVTYGGKNGDDGEAYRTFILNYNSFDIMVKYGDTVYEIKAYGYQVVNH